MRYNYSNVVEQFVTCSKGARLLVRGIRDPNVFNATILVCPVHQDKIVIPSGMPKRKWEFIKVISEGEHALDYSSQFTRLREHTPDPYILPGKPRDPLYNGGSKVKDTT